VQNFILSRLYTSGFLPQHRPFSSSLSIFLFVYPPPNKSPEPTGVGACSSAVAGDGFWSPVAELFSLCGLMLGYPQFDHPIELFVVGTCQRAA
jgi:hypothetical protein